MREVFQTIADFPFVSIFLAIFIIVIIDIVCDCIIQSTKNIFGKEKRHGHKEGIGNPDKPSEVEKV